MVVKPVLLYFWKASKGLRGRIGLSCLNGILNVGFSLAFIWTSKLVIDIATGVRSGSLWQMGAITVLFLVLQLLCGIFDSWLTSRMQVEGGNALRRRIFSNLLQSQWNELERFHTGDVVNRIEKDSHTVTGLLIATLPAAIVTGIQLIASFVFFCMLDRSLPWLLVGILPLFLLAGRFYSTYMQRYTSAIRQSDSDIQSVIQESIQHQTVIKTLEQNDRHVDKLDKLQDSLRTQVNRRTQFSLFSRSIVAFVFSAGYLTAFLWGAVRLSQGSITFGTMTAFLQLVGKLQRPVLDLARMVPSGVSAITSVKRLMELEALATEVDGEKIAFTHTPSILIENVFFSYPNKEEAVFNGLSMAFPTGEQIAIMGETGKGKTTLVRLLLALANPQQGGIYLTDATRKVPVSPLTRCNFVYVPQGNTLFSGTIRDNLLRGNPNASTDEMHEVLRTSVAEFVFSLPRGIDTHIGEQGHGLSEGQAQRIAIARALLRPGNILLLDEATSALDAATEKRLIENLKKYGAHKTILFITHQSALVEMCDRVYCLGLS